MVKLREESNAEEQYEGGFGGCYNRLRFCTRTPTGMVISSIALTADEGKHASKLNV